MFRESNRTDDDVAAIRAALASADPAGGELDATAAARLASIRHAVISPVPSTHEPRRAGRRTGKPQPAPGRWTERLGQRRRRALITVAAVPVLLAASAAGWAISSALTATQVTDGVGCYAAANLQADTTVVAASGQDPVSICARYWADGVVTGKRGQQVPPLVACVLPGGGAVGVFPGTTCAAMRLQPLPPGYRSAAQQFSAFTAELTAWFHGARCVPEPLAVTHVKAELAQHGLSGWRVVGYTPQPRAINGPCATFTAESRTQTIYVQPAAGQGVEAVTIPALNRPSSACTPGHTPESAQTVTRQLHAALVAAGYGQWKIVIVHPTSTAEPCYSAGYDPATRQVSLSSYGGV
jgi:hypothetical protein